MTATLPLHALFLYLLLGEPVLGRLAYRRFLRRVRENGAVRARYYLVTIATEWVLVALLALGAVSAGISRAALGIGPVLPDPLGLGGGLSGALGLGILAGALVGVVLPLVLVRSNAGYRDKARTALERIRPLLPTTPGQRALFALLSLTAGICEELLFRSFLFWYLRGWLGPIAGFELLLIVPALIFGLAHAYQGVRGVLLTGALGLAFGMIFLLTGSVLPAMLLHAAIDLRILGLIGILPREPAPATT